MGDIVTHLLLNTSSEGPPYRIFTATPADPDYMATIATLLLPVVAVQIPSVAPNRTAWMGWYYDPATDEWTPPDGWEIHPIEGDYRPPEYLLAPPPEEES